MKVFINKILILLAISLIGGSCSEDDQVVLNPAASTSSQLSTSEVVLEKDNAGMDVLTVTWTEPDFGYAASANYMIYFDKVGGNFTNAQSSNGGRAFSKTFKNEELNKILLNLDLEPGQAAEIQVKVKAVLNDRTGYGIDSNINNLMATAYADVLDLSTPWGLVGSATPNGWDGPDVPFYKTDEAGVYVAYVTLTDGEWKIRKDNDWAVNYGDDGADGTLEPGGANIVATAGTYKVTFNENASTYTVEKYTWGLVGSATTNGWDGPDMPMMYDSFSDTWKAVVTLADGEMKFRFNNDWGTNYGDTGLDGILDAGGDNIPVSKGNYLITMDLNNLTYSIEETDIWGVVGSGYNDWGAAGPDFPFTPDFSQEGVYYISSITLLTGEIKFRPNNDWPGNYGDDGGDGTLEPDGANIPSTAGTYSIIMDLSNPDNPTYSITAK
ncbi:SusE domain-containing protein [Namhaeicola litoreus]